MKVILSSEGILSVTNKRNLKRKRSSATRRFLAAAGLQQ
jgi:hypothetical protein